MTIPQIEGFITAISKRDALNRAYNISNIAIGAQGDAKGIKSSIQSLINPDKRNAKKGSENKSR
jgi:hypothetical protein